MGEDRTRRLGVGKGGGSRGSAVGLKHGCRSSLKPLRGEHGWVVDTLHPPLASDQGCCVCCLQHSAFAVGCRAFGCFTLYFRGTIQQVPVGGWDHAVVSPERALAVPQGRTAILSF